MIVTNVIIVGAGPAGIGIGALLKQTNVDFVILEKNEVGNSFSAWPSGMEMITPSFPSNAFGQMDLNSICESTSPGYSFRKEHVTGPEYARYLSTVVKFFDLPVHSNTEVKKVTNQMGSWILDTSQGMVWGRYLIWAGGEFFNPQINNIDGAEHGIHSSLIKHPADFEGEEFVVVGGYESGVQMAFDLIKNDKKVSLVNPCPVDDMSTSDPSRVLSPYTYTKYKQLRKSPLYTEILGEVTHIAKKDEVYVLLLKDEKRLETKNPPICATGFALVHKPIEEFISYREDGFPKLKPESDELFGWDNIYLSGPSVRHEEHIFCFIYKFRQRFGVILEDILKKENGDEDSIRKLVNRWKNSGMYLSDLSCCGDECIC